MINKADKVCATEHCTQVQGGLESVLRCSDYVMPDMFMENGFRAGVGVNSRLWWAEKQVGGEEETVVGMFQV